MALGWAGKQVLDGIIPAYLKFDFGLDSISTIVERFGKPILEEVPEAEKGEGKILPVTLQKCNIFETDHDSF